MEDFQVQIWLNEAFKHAEKEYPKESCGVVYVPMDKEDMVYYPCRNMAARDEHFFIRPQDYADCEDRGKILKIVHSHPNYPAKPSQADMAACEKSGLPWVILGWPSKTLKEIEPHGYVPPLEGREFSFGILDCYTIVVDYYRDVLGIHINDHEREDHFWERNVDHYCDENFKKEGFVVVDFDNIQEHDLIFMALRSKVMNHVGVFLGFKSFGGRTNVPVMLHHLQDRLSEKIVYGGFWHKNMRRILRHKKMFEDYHPGIATLKHKFGA